MTSGVEPIRSKEAIEAIKVLLRPKPRDYLLFVLGINVALRIGDLLQLRVSDVWEGGPRDTLRLREAKTGNARVIPLNYAAKGALVQAGVGEMLPAAYLFASQVGGGPITRQYAWSLVNQWCAAVGLSGRFGTHSLRKTQAHWAWKGGTPIETVQEALGHSSPAITRRYLGIAREDVEAMFRETNL